MEKSEVRVLLDLNILLDVFLKREPFYEDSLNVMNMCLSKKIKGVIAAHSITNLWYVLRKTCSDEQRREIVLTLIDSFEISSIDKDKIKAGILRKDFKDFEDCLQDECAKSFNSDYIITRDKDDFVNSVVPVLLPTEFVA